MVSLKGVLSFRSAVRLKSVFNLDVDHHSVFRGMSDFRDLFDLGSIPTLPSVLGVKVCSVLINLVNVSAARM